MTYKISSKKIEGFGLGLRHDHFDVILETKPDIDWFEVITENFMMPGGNGVATLTEIRQHYALAFHGVSLSIGSCDAMNRSYLKRLKETIKRFDPHWVSDHLCWTGINHHNSHDLLPIPYTEESLKHVVSRLVEVQDYLGHAILIENPSSYITFAEAEMNEWDFLARMAEQSGCYLLLDVNNVYVSSVNHGFSATEYINAIPKSKVKQIHLAGHTLKNDVIIDTHDQDIIEPVLSLYKHAMLQLGFVPTMIERDDNIPPLSDLMRELNKVKEIVSGINDKKKVAA